MTGFHTQTAALLACLAFTASARAAIAQEAPASQDDTSAKTSRADGSEQRVKELFLMATSAYREEDFARAATLYQQAYMLEPRAILLYNAARANYRQGELALASAQLANARRADQGHVPLTPAQEEKAVAFARELDAATRRSRAQAQATPKEGARVDEAHLRVREDRESPALSSRGLLGVGALGLAVTGFSVAMMANRRARATLNTLSPDGAAADEEALRQRLVREQRVGKAAFYTGGVLTLVGGGLLVHDVMVGPTETKLSLSPNNIHLSIAF